MGDLHGAAKHDRENGTEFFEKIMLRYFREASMFQECQRAGLAAKGTAPLPDRAAKGTS
jgi:hypothetical protein